MVHGNTPQENAYNQGESNNQNQNDMNNATGGARRKMRRKMRRATKGRKSHGRRATKGRRSRRHRTTKGRKSHRHRATKGRKSHRRRATKGRKSRKRMRGGGSACPTGFVMAEVGAPLYPDRSGGDQTVAHQTTAAQSAGMQMGAQSALDGGVQAPPS